MSEFTYLVLANSETKPNYFAPDKDYSPIKIMGRVKLFFVPLAYLPPLSYSLAFRFIYTEKLPWGDVTEDEGGRKEVYPGMIFRSNIKQRRGKEQMGGNYSFLFCFRCNIRCTENSISILK